MRYNVLFTTQQNICFGFGIFVNNKQLCMEEEIWKDVVGFEGKYSISSLGRLRSNARTICNTIGLKYDVDEYILNPRLRADGYSDVALSITKYKRKYVSIHRLVATAFIPNPNNLKCVDHIDRNRSNNVLSNLRWCTHKENYNFPLSKEAHQLASNKRGSSVVQLTPSGVFISEYESMAEASRTLDIASGWVSRCIKYNKVGRGFLFMNKDDYDKITQKQAI